MSHFSRLPSDVRTKAPLRVPTRTRTPLIFSPSPALSPQPQHKTAQLAVPNANSFEAVIATLERQPPRAPAVHFSSTRGRDAHPLRSASRHLFSSWFPR